MTTLHRLTETTETAFTVAYAVETVGMYESFATESDARQLADQLQAEKSPEWPDFFVVQVITNRRLYSVFPD